VDNVTEHSICSLVQLSSLSFIEIRQEYKTQGVCAKGGHILDSRSVDPKQKKNFIHTFTFMLPRIVIDFFLNNQPDALIIQILFCYKTLHVSDLFAHHQEFSTVHSALGGFAQVFLMTVSKQSQDGTFSSILTLLGNGQKTCMKPTSAECTVENS
jgi:hypothetical protein